MYRQFCNSLRVPERPGFRNVWGVWERGRLGTGGAFQNGGVLERRGRLETGGSGNGGGVLELRGVGRTLSVARHIHYSTKLPSHGTTHDTRHTTHETRHTTQGRHVRPTAHPRKSQKSRPHGSRIAHPRTGWCHFGLPTCSHIGGPARASLKDRCQACGSGEADDDPSHERADKHTSHACRAPVPCHII